MSMANVYIIPLLILVLGSQLNSSNALQCWDCNSAYDPRCGSNFDNVTLALVDCDQRQISMPSMKDKKPMVCRKLTQELAEDNTRIIRSCGWLEDDSVGTCITKVGTNHVRFTYCACTTDGCNPATTLQVLPSLMGISSVMWLLA